MRLLAHSSAIVLLGLAAPLLIYFRGGFFAALIFGSLLGLASLDFAELKKSFKNVINKKYFKLIVPLYSVIIVSTAFAINQGYSIKKLIDISIILFITSLLAIYLNTLKKQDLQKILKIMAISTSLGIGVLFIDMFVVPENLLIAFYGFDDIGPGRVRYPANILSAVGPLAFGYLYYLKKDKTLAWVFLAFLFLFIVASGGRSALLAFIVGLGFMLLVMLVNNNNFCWKKLVLGLLSFIALLVVGVTGYKVLDKRTGKNEYQNRMSINASDLSAGRFGIWQFTLEKSLESPLVGVGVGGYRTLTANADVKLAATNHPHNFVLEVLVSTGFIGLIVTLTVLLYLFIQYFTFTSGFAVFSLSSFVAYWVNSLTSVSILQTYWLALFAFTFTLGYFMIKKDNK